MPRQAFHLSRIFPPPVQNHQTVVPWQLILRPDYSGNLGIASVNVTPPPPPPYHPPPSPTPLPPPLIEIEMVMQIGGVLSSSLMPFLQF